MRPPPQGGNFRETIRKKYKGETFSGSGPGTLVQNYHLSAPESEKGGRGGRGGRAGQGREVGGRRWE